MRGSVRRSGVLRRLSEEWTFRTSLAHTPVRKAKTEMEFRESLLVLRRLFDNDVRRDAVLERLRRLLGRDIRWVIAHSGGGSLRPMLDDILAIANGCSIEEIIAVFPVALVDEWAFRQPANGVKRRSLADAWTRRAESANREDISLLAANLSTRAAERSHWLEHAFAASGVSAGLDAVEAQIPFEFRTCEKSESGPLVTVLMSAFNSASTIRRAAKSILNQTWRNVEVIITDDASTDETGSLIAALAQEDERVKIRRNDRNVGTYISRNMALSVSTGQFITCHDADDIAHPEKLALQMQSIMGGENSASIISRWIRMERGGRVMPTSLTSFVQEDYSSLLIRREVFDAIGYWDSVRTSGDSEYRERVKRRFGTQAEKELSQILSIGQFSGTTLTGSPETEVSWLKFASPRVQYREAYKAWHKSVPAEEIYMPFPIDRRPFAITPDQTSELS
ncbi:Glycosyl transferase family 2 [Hyphomicrobium facile]|uniref:Glycosyl transferase family 2 n=2 Tax=Hyphomicrobium facile TaxID=51670 RepID=A0A1I7NI90_9HYPH|nr:Glycosyl transferase family 2 [Hyphomicrobium facile]